jgi:hypothetical protein
VSGDIWISHAMIDPAIRVTPLLNDLDDQVAIDALNRNELGEPLPRSMFPTAFWAAEASLKLGSLPDVFWANAFIVVSARCAEVLETGDLGRGSLYPVRLLQFDRSTEVTGPFFCLNFGNTKDVFLPQDSPGADQNPFNRAIWYPETKIKDGDIAVSAAALYGPDIWISPPLKKAFFVSERTASGLRGAGVARGFCLRSCRVV